MWGPGGGGGVWDLGVFERGSQTHNAYTLHEATAAPGPVAAGVVHPGQVQQCSMHQHSLQFTHNMILPPGQVQRQARSCCILAASAGDGTLRQSYSLMDCTNVVRGESVALLQQK